MNDFASFSIKLKNRTKITKLIYATFSKYMRNSHHIIKSTCNEHEILSYDKHIFAKNHQIKYWTIFPPFGENSYHN